MLFTTVAIVFFFSNYIHPEFGPLAFNACGYFGLALVNEIFSHFIALPLTSRLPILVTFIDRKKRP